MEGTSYTYIFGEANILFPSMQAFVIFLYFRKKKGLSDIAFYFLDIDFRRLLGL